MNYQRLIGLAIYALAFVITVLIIAVTHNPLGILAGVGLVYLGWRVRWAQ